MEGLTPMIRHGLKLKRYVKTQKLHKPQESIEIVIRDSDGKKLFSWGRSRGNLNQGLYEMLNFVGNKMGIPLDDIMESKEIL